MQYVAIAIALWCVFVGVVFWARTEFTKPKFIALTTLMSLFLLFMLGVVFVQEQSVPIAMVLCLSWLWVLFFYAFGTRYISHRGFSQDPIEVDLGAFANDSERKSFANILRVCQHVLAWPMVALLVFILIRGFLGYGWIMKLN